MPKEKTVCAILFLLFLAACGGGGGGGSGSSSASSQGPVASTLDFPVAATVLSVATTFSSHSVSTIDAQGNTDVLTVSYTPGPSVYDPLIYNSALSTFTQTDSLAINGTTTSTSSVEVFYSTSPFLVWGSINGSSGQNTMRISVQTQLPTTAKVGATGAIYSGSNYINNSTLFPDTQAANWSLLPDTVTTAWLCLSTTETQALSLTGPTTEADCFRIDQTGAVSGFKVEMTVPSNCTAYSCSSTTVTYQ